MVRLISSIRRHIAFRYYSFMGAVISAMGLGVSIRMVIQVHWNWVMASS